MDGLGGQGLFVYLSQLTNISQEAFRFCPLSDKTHNIRFFKTNILTNDVYTTLDLMSLNLRSDN